MQVEKPCIDDKKQDQYQSINEGKRLSYASNMLIDDSDPEQHVLWPPSKWSFIE